MRKLAIVLAMLAMLLLSAIPALAYEFENIDNSFNYEIDAQAVQVVTQEVDQTVNGDVEGGDAEAEAEEDSEATATGGDATGNEATQDAHVVQYANDYAWWW